MPIGGVGNPPVTLINGGGGGSTQGGGSSGGTTGNGSGRAQVQGGKPGANRSVTYDPNCLLYFGDLITDLTGGEGGTAPGDADYGTQSRYAFGGMGGGGGGGIVINWAPDAPATTPGPVKAANGQKGGNCKGNSSSCGEGSGGLEGFPGSGGNGYGSGGGGAGGNAALCGCSETKKPGGAGYPKTWIVRVDYAIKEGSARSDVDTSSLHQTMFEAQNVNGMYPCYTEADHAAHHSPSYEYSVAMDESGTIWYLPVGRDLYLNVDPVIPAPNQKLNRPDLPCAECTGSDPFTAAEAEYFADILTNLAVPWELGKTYNTNDFVKYNCKIYRARQDLIRLYLPTSENQQYWEDLDIACEPNDSHDLIPNDWTDEERREALQELLSEMNAQQLADDESESN